MAVVERGLHDRKELWFPYLVCKNNEFFVWCKTDTAVRTANWLRLNITVHQKFRNNYSVPVSYMEAASYRRLFPLDTQYPNFFSVVQLRFDN